MVILGVAMLVACQDKKTEANPAVDEVERLSDNEKDRGREACATYIERLCRCAESHPEYQKECALIRNARPDALEKTLAASESVDDPNVRWRTRVTARRIMSRCIEDDNRLDVTVCPRVPSVKPNASDAEAASTP